MDARDTDDAVDRLATVVSRYGRNALRDPVTLRAALRDTGARFTEPERTALIAVAGSPGLTEVLTGPGEPAISEAAARIATSTGLPAGHIGWALSALAAALRPPGAATRVLPGQPAPEYRVNWDTPSAAAHPTTILPVRRRSWWLVGVLAVVVALAATGVVVFTRSNARSTPPPDRYAVDQVAQRYRALGARLLDGVAHCAQLPVRVGEVERVGCGVAGYSLTLVTYDGPSRLTDSLDGLAATPDVMRTARFSKNGAAFDMLEARSGRSTVYWHIDIPRPVSATLTADHAGLPTLVSFYDTRQFGGVKRGDVPGPAFNSGELFFFAQGVLNSLRPARCLQQDVTLDVTEFVKCPLTDQTWLTFAKEPTKDAFLANRGAFGSDSEKVPGSVKVGTWTEQDDNHSGQLILFVALQDNKPTLYWDDQDLLTWGTLNGPPGGSLDAVKAQWTR